MSMLETLAKVAIGVALEKGVGGVLKNGGKGGGLLGSGSRRKQSKQGGIEDLLGDLLSGGRRTGSKKQGGGLGDLLEQLGGGLSSGKSSDNGLGGLGDLIGGLSGGQTRGGDPIGDIFGDFLGNAIGGSDDSSGSFGDIFNEAIAGNGISKRKPNREQELASALMLRAMVHAALSDGKVDRTEQGKLFDNLGDISAEQKRYIKNEMDNPMSATELAGQVPNGMERQIYLMSLMAIDLDNRDEAEYLHDLATQLDLGRADVNDIHEQLGVVPLYR